MFKDFDPAVLATGLKIASRFSRFSSIWSFLVTRYNPLQNNRLFTH